MPLTAHAPLTIDEERFAADLSAMSAIGWTNESGMQRTTFSDAHAEVRTWFLDRARAAGLRTRVDGAGNHSAILEAADPRARTLLLGSHLDSVPSGGRFDGALGVLCGLEVLRSVRDAGLDLPMSLEAIDFTDEEGAVLGTLGSWALAGELTSDALASPRCGRDVLLSGLERMGTSEEGLLTAARDPAGLAGFLELHIEQGPVLERAGVAIGIVTGICGSVSFDIVFRGAARHAGTTPMDARRDAGLAAAALMLEVRETVTRDFAGCVATVGDVHLEPGAYNVIPGVADLKIEARAQHDDELDRLSAAITELARAQARRWDLDVHIESTGRWSPEPTDPRMRAAIAASASRLGLTVMEMPSGAGHDAQVMAKVTASGMAFVPSHHGISHHPDEYSSLEDCINGSNVLLGATLALAEEL
jgi:N-carbamoyl-L-amino-acid hydrolase